MNYASINIQGNIVSSDILTKIRLEEMRHQSPADFGLDRNTSVREEIGLAWSNAQNFWKSFKQRRDRLKESDSGTSETRQGWMIPFLRELGYDLELGGAEILNGKSYAISHRAGNIDGFPVHIVGVNQSLDKRAERGTRLSPHALTQEYLNNTEHLYAITTNGNFLRVLRDATRLSRLSYIEFDLERMMEDELYAEFALLFRVLHSTRMPQKLDSGADSIIEFYHQEALASGTRIRNRLSESVEKSIRLLANGLLHQAENKELREQIRSGNLSAEDYYLNLLRSIYRVLFLMVIEERNLIYPANRNEETNAKRSIYYDYYSLQRLAKLAERKIYVDPRKTDLWQSLLTTFTLFVRGQFGTKLGIEPLGAGLFGPTAIGPIAHAALNNESFLALIRNLVTFENENGQLTRVNYADLDVEEFGSVYEGLLEYDPIFQISDHSIDFSFVEGSGRSSSGSHYTPEELVKPLIKHSLDYIIADKLKAGEAEGTTRESKLAAQAQHLLSISVCDVACGSGHILLSAARRIGMELAIVRESLATKHEVEQPSPTFFRAAVRDAIRHCIYGVDLNPLAVELCKVALWLEAHNPGEPLNFLDHKIKNGNAIVGLAHFNELENGIASEAFKTLPGDEKEVASTFKKKNDAERKQSEAERKSEGQQITLETNIDLSNSLKGLRKEFADFEALPENTPAQIEAKTKAYQDLTTGKKWYRLKNLANVQVAQFFIPKTLENKEKLSTEAKYRTYLNAGTQILDRGASLATAQEKRFFHWFLEFPEVFAQGGFDCILGNPPYLGGQKLTGTYGHDFAQYVRKTYEPIGSVDLITYFFRRIFSIINEGGFMSLISTNTISQGAARLAGLSYILSIKGVINHAVRSMPWPGLAAVDVSLVTIVRGDWTGKLLLDHTEVVQITSFLDDQELTVNPFQLAENKNKSFQGSIVLGKGFVLEPEEAEQLFEDDDKNKDVIQLYLNGDDLNNNIDQCPSRWVINFLNWPEEKAQSYPSCYRILQEKVLPIRLTDNRKAYRDYWWQYAEKRERLYELIENTNEVLAACRVSKYVNHSVVRTGPVFDVALSVVLRNEWNDYACLQSTLHNEWAWKYASTLESRIRYTNGDCIDTFPLVHNAFEVLKNTGNKYHEFRSDLMSALQLGLTKTYNQFHCKVLVAQVEALEPKAFSKKYGKETWNLYNHLEIKKEGNISYEEAVPLIFKLRELHKEMDEAVLAAYGWHEASEKWGKAINLRHDFYEVDYLPENDRVRYTIHPDARKEVLKRLLLLNHERFEEEVARGLHKREDVEKYYQQKGKPMPLGTVFSDGKKAKTTKAAANQKPKVALQPRSDGSVQSAMFAEAAATTTATIKEGSKVALKNESGSTFHYILLRNAVKGNFTGAYKQIATTSGLAEAMLGLGVGEKFEFGGVGYEVKEMR